MTDPTAIGPPVWQGPRLKRRRPDIDWSDPFSRLALCHFGSVSGEALLALSLAGSLFFKVDPANGREKVLLGLVLTMAPFALVGPFIGPLIDKVPGGHRVVIILTLGLRAVIAVAMAVAAADNSLVLFPEAFLMLVLGKTYQVAKAAEVPAAVEGDAELVEANSKLQLRSGISTLVAGLPGAVLLLAGPEWVLGLAAMVFTASTVSAFGLARGSAGAATAGGALAAPTESERAVLAARELRSAAVMTAATSMAILRAMVGLVTFALAFELRGGSDRAHAPPTWYFGAVIGASIVGGLVGASMAPPLRKALAEEKILLGSTSLAAAVGLVVLLLDGLPRDLLLAIGIAIASTVGKQAFDALVQRDAPDEDRGRLFARFESRFQVVWVVGALVPTAIHLPVAVGAAMVLVAGVVATTLFATGMRQTVVVIDEVPEG